MKINFVYQNVVNISFNIFKIIKVIETKLYNQGMLNKKN